ncbi:MAG: hypothetical protein L3J32_09050, partial [Rhizobiaceae bacterium]|nr:hypothetical protein [Rhizobiaceae bacterium]
TDTTTFTAAYTITQGDIDLGSFTNQAIATGNPPTGPPVSDLSDESGTGPGDNGATVTPLPSAAALQLTKSITSTTEIFPYVYDIIYTIGVENTGNVTSSIIRVSDDLDAALTPGVIVLPPTVGVSGFAGTPTANAGYNGVTNTELLDGNPVLAPGASGTVVITVRVDFTNGYSTQGNTAYGSSDNVPGPVPSDDPSVTPGDGSDTNPTPVPVTDEDNDGAPDSAESAVNDRDGDGIPDARDYDPTGYFYCEETGGILNGALISITGPLGTQSGVGTSSNITIVRDGSSGFYQFHVSAPGTYSMSYVLPTNGSASTDRLAGGVLDVTSLLPDNPAVLGAGEIGATGLLSDSSATANPFFVVFDIEAGDPQVFNNNIPLKFCGAALLTANKQISSAPVLLPNGNTQITYLLSAENTGSMLVNNVSMIDDLDAAFGAGNHTITNLRLDSVPAGFTGVVNAGFDGAGSNQLFGTNGNLEPGETVSLELVVEVSVSNSGTYTNTIIAGGQSPLDGSAIPTNSASVDVDLITPGSLSGLQVTKTASRPTVRIGEVVSYTIRIENTDALARNNVELVDFMPAGFTYRPGSAAIDGVQIDPAQNGRRLVWPNQSIAANTTAVLTLSLGVGAAASEGEFTNLAWVEDPVNGNRISTIGKATVRREFEFVFDCGEIIGKVFDDKNRNGYQDDGEPGLPGVRVVTVNGVLITTDKHGRYNVPCAAIPDARIGSNFILKLDTRTLPTGYRVISENPRVVRLTRGKVTKLNFAASIHRVVRIDIDGSAFSAGKTQPGRKLLQGIDKLIDVLGSEQSVLRISYRGDGKRSLGKARLRAFSKLVLSQWKKSGGGYDLDIETRFVKRK